MIDYDYLHPKPITVNHKVLRAFACYGSGGLLLFVIESHCGELSCWYAVLILVKALGNNLRVFR
jgi:hypothetical protein